MYMSTYIRVCGCLYMYMCMNTCLCVRGRNERVDVPPPTEHPGHHDRQVGQGGTSHPREDSRPGTSNASGYDEGVGLLGSYF